MRLAAPVFVVSFLLAVAAPAAPHSGGGLPGLLPDLRAACPGSSVGHSPCVGTLCGAGPIAGREPSRPTTRRPVADPES